ncbi:MAG: hypothetical protein WD646_14550 [Actinomycetota bacterium]
MELDAEAIAADAAAEADRRLASIDRYMRLLTMSPTHEMRSYPT